MAESTGVNDLFKFYSVRNQPRVQETRQLAQVGEVNSTRSALRQQVDGLEGDAQAQRKAAAEFIGANKANYSELETHIAYAFSELLGARELRHTDIISVANYVVSKMPAFLTNQTDSERQVAIGHLLHDMALALSLPPDLPAERDRAIRYLRLWYLSTSASSARLFPSALDVALNRVAIIFPKSIRKALAKDRRIDAPKAGGDRGEKAVGVEKNGNIEEEIVRLRNEVGVLNDALEAVREGVTSGRAMRIHKERIERKVGKVHNPSVWSRLSLSRKRNADVVEVIDSLRAEFDPSLLANKTQETIAKFVNPIGILTESEFLEQLGKAISERESQISQLRKLDNQWLIVGNLLVKKLHGQPSRVQEAVSPKNASPSTNTLSAGGNTPQANTMTISAAAQNAALMYYGGVADLRIVRERLIAYELADIAHIENVLAGEEKERRHRRFESTETEEVVLTENEQETERDNQSTTKNELATESSTVAKETVNVQGSLTVSGSYGPSVEFSANAAAGYTGETTTTDKRATAFAQEVVQKTVEKVRSRVMEQRRVKTVKEIEETNLHAIRNAFAGAQHIRGVYRWLNKITEAQVYNYGARHMFTFEVPEPASYYLWTLGNDEAATVTEPVAPTFTAEDITFNNYLWRAAEFGASGIKAPPITSMTISKVLKTDAAVALDGWDGVLATKVASAALGDVIKIPKGYDAIGVYVHVGYSYVPDYGGGITAQIGTRYSIAGSGYYSLSNRFTGELSCNVMAYSLLCYHVGFDVLCTMYNSSELGTQWKIDTFEAIMEGYKGQLAKYEEKLASAAIQQGIAVPGRNPLENETIIKNELKRACLSMYLGIDLDSINAFRSTDPASPDYWKINYAVAPTLGFQIAFMERAFEWENMTYIFSPYFYGRYGEWGRRVIQLADPDPKMAAFLRAGAARVLVPARPEFAEALLQYAQIGDFSSGAESLLTAGDAIEAMIEEVRARGVDSFPNAVPEGDPWEVRLPTSLVLLQDPKDLTFRDLLYGDQNGEALVSFDLQDPPPQGANAGNAPATGGARSEAVVSSRRQPSLPRVRQATRSEEGEMRQHAKRLLKT